MKIATIWNPSGEVLAKLNAIPPYEIEEAFYLLRILYIPAVTTENYELVEKAKKGKVCSQTLVPKHYILRSQDTAKHPDIGLALSNQHVVNLFPSRRGSAASMTSTSSVLENAANEVAMVDAVTKLPPADVVRYAKFALHVAMRDRSCVVTGDSNPAHLVGAHIVPFSWSKRGLADLPEDVRDTLASTRLGLDDLSNGVFLSSRFYETFDNGSWSVVFRWRESGRWADFGDDVDFDQGDWIIVPITEDCPTEIVGTPLRVPEGLRGDGSSWRSHFPPATLWWFHLKASVFKHCRGACGGEDIRKGGDKFDVQAYRVLNDEHHFESDIDSSMMSPALR